MPAPKSPIPARIDQYRVIETGAFSEPRLPLGYMPPPDGGPPLSPVRNVAICEADGVDGYYTLFCTDAWEYVTCDFNDIGDILDCKFRFEQIKAGKPVLVKVA